MKQQWVVLISILLSLTMIPAGTVAPVDADVPMQEELRCVALTFDDGPKAGTTDVLLDGLRERGAAATFFLVGDQAVMYPDLVRRMQQEGHQVGNHTWSHQRLEGNTEEALREVRRMDGLLREILGEGSYWLRPPYGIVAESVMKQVEVPLVKWSVDPRDWEDRNAEKVTERVLAEVRPNSIVLLHDIYPTSVTAALRVVDALQEQGYWFVTVEELLKINGITPQKGVFYRFGA